MTGENLTFLDDSHVLPFDGVVKWQNVANRLKKTGIKDGYITLEITVKPKEGRNTHDIYSGWDYKKMYKEALSRAVQIAKML